MKKVRVNTLLGKKPPEFSMDSLKATNPKFAKKLKKQFDVGFEIVLCQSYSGLSFSSENQLRYYLREYNKRFWRYGPESFPTSLNVIEPFMDYNFYNGCFELLDEENYVFSLFDFVDFITSSDYTPEQINLADYIQDDLIYHFNIGSPLREISFQSQNSKEYFIGNISLVKRENELTVLLCGGEKYTHEEAQDLLSKYDLRNEDFVLNPHKASLGLEIDPNVPTEIVSFDGDKQLCFTIFCTKFDLENRTIDFRYLANDLNNMFAVVSDNISHLINEKGEFEKEGYLDLYLKALEKLDSASSLTEISKYAMYLPYWVQLNEDKISHTDYKTTLDELIHGPTEKRKYKNVKSKYKLFSKPVYVIDPGRLNINKPQKIRQEGFVIETSGYWRKLGHDEKGEDKKGRLIIGKTWVERTDTYVKHQNHELFITEKPLYTGENSGYIYIMRQASMEPNIFKIGLTTRNTFEREKELSNTSVPDKFITLAQFSSKDCFEAEKVIHEKLSEYRISEKREFFRLDIQQAYSVISQIVTNLNSAVI